MKVSRRKFLQQSGLAVAAVPTLVPSHVLGKDAPSEIVTMGFIGVGSQGTNVNLKYFLRQDDCRALAVCDVQPDKRENARNLTNDFYDNQDCAMYTDFRDVLSRKDIDAVCISTPDHWHVPMSLMALDAGKDVICEKPTLTIKEGRDLVNKVQKTGRVFTVGLEDRAMSPYYKLAEAVRNGAIGKLHTIHVGLPYKKTVWPIQLEAPVPEDLHYKMWLGPAPYAPYTENRLHPQCWRQIDDYAAGTLTDWGMHLCDTAQVANFSELTSPVRVEGTGVIPENAMNSVPNQFDLKYTFANGVVMNVKSTQPSIRLEGSEGWCGNKGWLGELEAHDLSIFKREYKENKIWPMPPREQRNFLDVIRFGKKPMYDAEALHRLSTTLLTGSIAMKLGRALDWSPEKEEFVNDDEANSFRSRPRSNEWINA